MSWSNHKKSCINCGRVTQHHTVYHDSERTQLGVPYTSTCNSCGKEQQGTKKDKPVIKDKSGFYTGPKN